LKEEIANLETNVKEDEIRVTVRRKHLWSDFTRARNEYFCPTNTVKGTFCGEPAIDDGGPKREFFTGGQSLIFDTFLPKLLKSKLIVSTNNM